jgi:F-type H+-transporting ATPase subunit b
LITEFILQPVLLAVPEGAAQGGLLSSPDLWRVINLLVFLAVFLYILRNKIRIGQVFDNRGAAIARELETARRDKQEAERKLAEVEARLGQLDQEVAEIRAEAERESARELERIRQAADADAEKIKQLARREIEGAVRASRTELRAFVAEHAVERAEALIRSEIRPEDNSRMLDRYLDGLSEVGR